MMNIYFTSRRDVPTNQLIMPNALLKVLLFSCQKNILHYVIAFGALPSKELCIVHCALCIMH